jgi:hypothetical protein
MICQYGCGRKAKFEQSNGNWCCESFYTKCPANRKKNSKGLSQAIKETRHPGAKTFDNSRGWAKGKFAYDDPRIFSKYDPDQLFKNGKVGGSKETRKRILIRERGHKCESCQLTKWLKKTITLELEHIDGNNKNWERSNLKLLCPNCHSYTPTWRRKKSSL